MNPLNRFVCSLLLTFVASSVCPSLMAQHSRVFHADIPGGNILTLRAEKEGRIDPLPVLRLGTGEMMEVSFDEMSHEYHRYVYRLQHCASDWQPSDGLFYSEYAEYTQEEVPVEEYVESQNVTTHYTHYSFMFPNSDMRPLLSGNYRLTILVDDDDEAVPVAEVCFAMLDPVVNIKAQVSTDTDVDINDAHQQVAMEIDCSRISARDLREEVRTVVMQNGRYDNAVIDAAPSYVNGDRLIWDHQRALVFAAGNEYRKFEILSARYPGLHTDRISYHDPFLHATLMDDECRRNYLLTEDQNGINVIRNIDNRYDDSETEYMLTHFTLLASEPLDNAAVYLNGAWTTGGISPEWQLHYDAAARAYAGTFMLKQGYYNYQYLVVDQTTPPEEAKHRNNRNVATLRGKTAPFEGDFYQTSNEYRILVYHSQPGARYDRLVGYKDISL